jgi:tetratricopeptide (TPR) repeat protein/tRNA A-37 threonylcarbamoyl transferase component Bud32
VVPWSHRASDGVTSAPVTSDDPKPTDTAAALDDETTQPGDPAMVEPSSWPPEPGPASRVGRFTVLRRVGAGAMGVVYAAYDDVLDRKVAIKLVTPRLAERAGARERMLTEAQALAKLRHPNVIQVYDAGVDDGRLFIAMEFVEGRTLQRWLAEAPQGRPWREVLQVFLQAGRGLAAAHAAQLVHCDFKPDNAMLGEDGQVRVMDFGLARAGGGVASSVEEGSPIAATKVDFGGRKAPIGTPAYMAPEQWGSSELGPWTDQCSYCIALFEALWGQRPFEASTVAGLAAAVLDGELREPADRRGVPERVRKAVLRGLATDPRQRWPSMNELLRVLASEPTSVRRWLLAGSAGAVIGGAVLASALASAPRPCATVDDALVGVWDADVRRRVHDGLLAAQAAHAEQTAARVIDALDAWSGALVEGRRDACEATHVRHEQSEELMLRRVRCLDARQRRFEALVGVLAGADAEILENAVDAARGLPSPMHCADLGYVSTEIPPPDDPEIAARVTEVDDVLAQLEALRAAGKYAELLRHAELAWKLAEPLDYPSIRVAALSALASAHYHRGDYDAAFEAAREAYVLSHAASPSNVAENHRVLGYVQDARGDYASALVEHRKATAIMLELWGPGDVRVVIGRGDIGATLHQQGKHEEALLVLRQALSELEAIEAPAQSEAATLHNNIAATLHGLGRTEESLVELRRVLELETERLGPTHPILGTYHGNIGSVLDALGRHEEALEQMRARLAIESNALGPHHPDVLDARRSLASVLSRLGRHDQAMIELTAVLAAFEGTLGPEHPSVAETLHGIAQSLSGQARHEDALAAALRAHAIWSKTLGPTHPDSIRALLSVAASRRRSGDAEGAARDAEQAAQMADEPDHPPALRARAKLELGYALWEVGRARARARGLVEQARELLAAGVGHEQELALAAQWLASHALEPGDAPP